MSLVLTLCFGLLAAMATAGAWMLYRLTRRLASLRSDSERLGVTQLEDRREAERIFEAWEARLEAVENRIAEFQQRPLSAINYTRRSQVLRLIRRGESPEHSAKTAGVPLNQVKLLARLPILSSPSEGYLQEQSAHKRREFNRRPAQSAGSMEDEV